MRKLSLLLVIAMISLFAAGCGGGAEPSSQGPPAESGGAPSDAATPADDGGQYLITLAHATADSTSLHHGAVTFKEEVERLSDGRIAVNVYPNAQMGGDRETIEGTQTGQITMMLSSNAVQVNFVSDAVIYDMPFVYPNVETARKTLADQDFINAISASYEQSGFHYVGTSDQGFRTLTANKEIRTPDDASGLTIRTMENKYHMGTWKAIGANPTPLAFNELYTALQQKTVDAQENPIELIYSQKFYEQQSYIIRTNHIFQTIVWIMNNDFYQELPEDLRKAVDDAAAIATQAACDYQDANLEEFEQIIRDYGCTFVDLTADELKAFEDKAKTSWSDIEADSSPQVYEAFMAALDKASA